MQEIYRVLARLMQTDLTLMITGESGTGKELVARRCTITASAATDPLSPSTWRPFRATSSNRNFSVMRRAPLPRAEPLDGRFEQARAGTLFLDEIGDMPMDAQTRLLRVLQQGEYTTVGGRTPIRTDVRIVAATNKDLKNLINQVSSAKTFTTA